MYTVHLTSSTEWWTVSLPCRDLTAMLLHIVFVIHPLNIWCYTMSFGRPPQHTHTTLPSNATHKHTFTSSWQARSQSLTSSPDLVGELGHFHSWNFQRSWQHRALLICSSLLLSVVLLKTFSLHGFSFTLPLCPFFLSSFFSSPIYSFIPPPFFFLPLALPHHTRCQITLWHIYLCMLFWPFPVCLTYSW